MLVKVYYCCLCLFFISLLGVLLNRKNIIITLLCIEVMILSVNLNFIIHSLYLDDILGQVFAFFIIALAAAESALGLGILISFFRVRQSMSLTYVLLKH